MTARSRADALRAVAEIGEQGEGLAPADENASHFQRFLAIYRGLKGSARSSDVVRRLAASPRTNLGGPDVGPAGDVDSTTAIVDPKEKLWAHLFNVRYRKLLVNLSHAFELSDDPAEQRPIGLRGTLIHRTFAEMYHLRSIAGRLATVFMSRTVSNARRTRAWEAGRPRLRHRRLAARAPTHRGRPVNHAPAELSPPRAACPA